MVLRFLWISVFALTSSIRLAAAPENKTWTFIGDETSTVLPSSLPDELPVKFSVFELKDAAWLKQAQGTKERTSRTLIPLPDGRFMEFEYWNSEVMHPDLAAQYPQFRTFQGFSLENDAHTLRFDISPAGLRGQGYSAEGLYYISPLGRNQYIVYLAKNYRPLFTFGCRSEEFSEDMAELINAHPLVNYGTSKRTYRLAISATAEYTQAAGGSVATALSSIVTAVNFINGIYTPEIGIEFQLVANNSSIIYTNALLDPFTPELGNTSMLAQNQTSTDLVIGNANYDIGHVVHNLAGATNTGSGVATLNSTCQTLFKARGVSTASRIGLTPMNPFFYRVMIHEIGHQLGAHHSFNSSCSGNRTDSTAYEPGGGSTIMSYAGGCSPYNVQTLADTYFHRISLEEIATYLGAGGGSCGSVVGTGNAIPTAEAGASYIIPRSTPFILTGVGTDANGNPLSYTWEQYNKEIATMPPLATSPSGPNFRSYLPATSSQRYFPRLSDVLSNLVPTWEVLPSVSRTMDFSLVVRDGAGGAASDNTAVSVDGASGPFVVTSPNGGETRTGTITVTWNPANSNLAPVNAALVDILLSTNNGTTFPTLLANDTPNDGSQSVTLPAISTVNARIQIKAEGNIFYDVSNAAFRITP